MNERTFYSTMEIDGNEITSERSWSSDQVRRACIRNNLYTLGTNEEYSNMLDLVDNLSPSLSVMYRIARNIYEHSEDQTITNVMYILEADAVITTFTMDGIA